MASRARALRRCSKLSADAVDALICSCTALRALNVHGALGDADAARIEQALSARQAAA